jgi:NADH-quinone oxidoreductase subunit D
MEAKTYEKAAVMTDRMDYLNNLGNNLVYCMAIEKLVDLDVPVRAQAIRVMMVELERISSHLVWLGTHALDLAAMSVFLYCFRERERILDLKEMVGGQRMMTTYFRPGGVWRDLPVEFEDPYALFLDDFPAVSTSTNRCLPATRSSSSAPRHRRPLRRDRPAVGCHRPGILRASGMPFDLRKSQPYSGYEQYDFDIPTAAEGDTYARYQVRMEEMRQSLRIIRQALEKLPYGPVRSNNRKFVPPPRSELGHSAWKPSSTTSSCGRRVSTPRLLRSMWRLNRRAASWASSWKAMAAPSPTASTGAPLPLSTCRSCLCSPKATWSPTW